jgi:hypothetical protein
VKDTPVYLATAAGKKHYNEIFPNDTERNPYHRAEKFLGHYSDWTGTGSNGKWEELAEKLGHYPDYEKNSHNYGTSYVKTARGQLRIKANDQDALLQAQAQLPTSNNNVSNFSLSLSLLLLVSRFNIISHPQNSPLPLFPSILDRRRRRCCVTTNWIDSCSYCTIQS